MNDVSLPASPDALRPSSPRKVVIIGGGAGGLELAATLGRTHGRDAVTLVDARPFHVWKPSLHEAAAGTLDIHQEGLSYLMMGNLSHFGFVLGGVTHIDRATRTITVAPVNDASGTEVVPERRIGYEMLVLAIGSTSNFFGTTGAAEHALTLDTIDGAEHFRLTMLKQMVQVDQAKETSPDARLNVVIVGGGATGVELAAELHEASHVISAYGLPHFKPSRDLVITLIEGAPRVLAALPQRISEAATERLKSMNVRIETGAKVSEVGAGFVNVADGRSFESQMCLWAAGIAGPALLKTLELPLNRIGQLEVDGTLQTTDPDVYAIGDCSAAPWKDGKSVPARAQAAHQQADYLAARISDRLSGRTPGTATYVYRDHGSLVSLGSSAGVGSLMGKLSGRGLFVSGTLARLMYMSLHLMHHKAVLGVSRTATLALARLLMRRTRPRVKLH